MTRREAVNVIGGTAAVLVLPISTRAASESLAMLTRAIPSSGEKLPVIGLGTWQAFDVDLTSDNRRQLADVLSLFVKLGGRAIDTSPMYGRAEDVIGELTTALGIPDKVFLATKVWTRGKEERNQINGTFDGASACETNRSDASPQSRRRPNAAGDIA
jgi:aryl-alcohol dehydrogenase-like predicted oxidoreductase